MAKGRKQRRLALIAAAGGALILATALVLVAMSDQIVFFKSPTEIALEGYPPGVKLRVGGLVKAGSIMVEGDRTSFIVTDTKSDLAVSYRGIVPDLFREGQGVVIDGALTEAGGFEATNLLAKHDENYMPREVVDALKEQGVWEGGGPAYGGMEPGT